MIVGICRIGEGLGKDFFHCVTCNVCMSIGLQDSHKCIENSTNVTVQFVVNTCLRRLRRWCL